MSIHGRQIHQGVSPGKKLKTCHIVGMSANSTISPRMRKRGQIQMRSVWMEQLVFSVKIASGQRAITGLELALASTIHNAYSVGWSQSGGVRLATQHSIHVYTKCLECKTSCPPMFTIVKMTSRVLP